MRLNNRILLFRRKSKAFYSIEKVFQVLIPYLNLESLNLPFESNGFLNRIRNIIFVLKQQTNAIHITGHDHYLLWVPLKNTILTIHDIEALRRKKGVKKWLFKKLWFDIPIKNALVVTTISEFTKQELIQLGGISSKIHVIPNPITISSEYIPNKNWGKRIKILQIGTKKNKNLNRLAQALKGENCVLTIIGKLSHTQINELAKNEIDYINKINLTEAELINEYLKTDLVAFVSTYEGFGLPIIEAQSIGRVVLTSNLSSMPEVAGLGAYFVNPYSVEAIKGGILNLRNDENLRQTLIEEGLINCKRFNPKSISEKYKKLYKSLEE